jgi:flagellar protein FliS
MNSQTQSFLLTYRESAVGGASPVRLVVLLYEQAIENLRRALAAQHKRDIEGRTREINHAILVIAHLQGSLDAERGGKVAGDLERFYDHVRAGLMAAQIRQSASLIERQIRDLLEVHDAWCEVERSSEPAPAAPGSNGNSSSRSGWKA